MYNNLIGINYGVLQMFLPILILYLPGLRMVFLSPKPMLLKLTLVTKPPSYVVASKFSHWIAAMDSEFASLQQQHSWSLVPIPYGKNVVGCKWAFKITAPNLIMCVSYIW